MTESATINTTPATQADTDALFDALEFAPSAQQCECTNCNANPRRQCPNNAQYCTRIHAFGECTNPEHAETGGFVAEFICRPCMAMRAAIIAHMFDLSHKAKQQHGNYAYCTSCRKELIETKHFWEVRPL